MFLTARSDEIDRVVGLELGADDYVPKPFSPRELVARVRTVLRRVSRTSGAGTGGVGTGAAAGGTGGPSVTASAPAAAANALPATSTPLVVDDERRRATFYGRTLDLSRYEFGLLRALAARPGRVYTREELLAKVWGEDTESFDRTVDAHVKTLRAKLKAIAPSLEPIVTHRGVGYAFSDALPVQLP
jgi:two-component system catabolic regulation response regulator CreB